ncbi:acetylxylan esterase [Treponema primitia]|uniref:alpha/beta hydrolase family protein n=1 Tax=Treponema primitia TaxID=88058 RepID=UPI003980D1EF
MKKFYCSIILLVVSMIGAYLVQTSGGSVIVKDLRWETSLGHQMSALLLIPPNATANNPAPAIVTSHGWYNTREMQDLNFVEYARRGFVVMSIDMYGHGNSEAPLGIDPDTYYDFSPTGWDKNGTGMYDAVLLMATFPYVNKSKIGITGHSNGARAVNLSIEDDNKAPVPLVAAAFLVANDPTYRNPANNEYWNVYGDRATGVIAAKYDEFFFRREFPDGTVSVPRTYIGTPDAQSFLHFGQDPYKNSLDKRVADTIYTGQVNGKSSIRVIYTPNQIHPWNHFSKTTVASGVEFFSKALDAPNPLPPGNQIWQLKVVFNAIGLVGFVFFLLQFTLLMLKTPAFASLKADKPVVIGPSLQGQGKLWFWGGLVIATLFSAVFYFHILTWSIDHKPSIFWQRPPYGIGLWAAFCGIISIILMVLSYKNYGKKNGQDLWASGALIHRNTLFKTIGLSILVVAVTYLWVFISDFFFKTDFRVWALAIKPFTADKLLVALPYLPLFLIYYVANSVSINAFNYNKLGNAEWINIAVLALFNSLASIILVLLQYCYFFKAGELLFTGSKYPLGHLGGIWQFPVIVILAVAGIVSRKIYKETRNPYLAGIINGILVTVISCTNTLTIISN